MNYFNPTIPQLAHSCHNQNSVSLLEYRELVESVTLGEWDSTANRLVDLLLCEMAPFIQVGLNRKIIGKTDPQKLSYAGAFIPTKITIKDLAEHIGKGHPWMPALLDKGARRWQAKANYADLLAVDIDQGLSIEDALNHPFISRYAALCIESASSSVDLHKYRIVFRLPECIIGWQTIRICNQYLIHLLKVADPACKDASRFFFGAPGRLPFLLNESAKLPDSFITDAAAWHEEIEREQARFYRESLERRSLYQGQGQDQFELVKSALSFIPPRKPGTGNYQECINVLMALNNEFGESDAIALGEWWAPSLKGNDWQVDKKIRSFQRGAARPIGIGTLFHIAKGYGFRFPESTPEQREAERRASGKISFERDPVKDKEREARDRLRYADLGPQITREEWQRIKLQQEIKRLYGKTAWRYYKRFGKLPQNAGKPPVNQAEPGECSAIMPYNFNQSGWWNLDVTPDSIPTPEQWVEMGRPKLVFAPEDGPAVYKRLINQYQVILDSSIVGDGKSRRVGDLLGQWETIAAELGIDAKAIYCSSDYRNPSNAVLERIEEAVSGAGLMLDTTRQTPNGKPYRRRANKGEIPDIAPLCVEDTNVQALRSKGISVGRGQDSPFCQVCPHFAGCGYLAAVKDQENTKVLRTDINKVSVKDEQVVLFVDEAGRAAKGSQVLTAWADTARREMMYLASYDPDLYHKLLPVLTQLTQGLERAIAERGKFGLSHEQVMGFLPSEWHIRELLMASDWHSWTRADDVWTKPTLNQIIGMFRKAMSPNLEAAFKNTDSSEQRAQVIDLELTMGLLPMLLKAITGDRWIDISIKSSGEIAITKGNKQHANTIQNAVSAVLLDATPDVATIARNLGLKQRDILQIEAKRPTFENLKIKLPRGLGKLGKQREHYHNGKVVETPYSQKNRVLAAVGAIAKIEKERVPDGAIGLLELKAYLNTYDGVELLGDAVKGYHFADNRNSNRFKDCTSLISVGAVVPNLNSLLSDWHIASGETIQSPRFWSWVQRQQTAEIIQGIGRLRAQHRPDQELTCWILTDLSERDITAIQEYYPGCQIEKSEIYDICPAAAPKGIQTERGIVESMWAALQSGTATTVNEIAAATGVTKGRVSQVASAFHGGFRGLKQSLILLLEAIESKTKLHLLDENERWIALEYLPAIAKEIDCNSPESIKAALQEFVSVAEGAGAAAFKRILASTPRYAVIRLLGAFLSLSPDEFQGGLTDFKRETMALLETA